ncbi:hypothetical protein Slin14017_G013970 [Septoria linicola]|nr:hypothetical protein Slin14017_G013970 [Septoria linicola]
MKASSSVVLAAATTSVSYLVAAYEGLTSTTPSIAPALPTIASDADVTNAAVDLSPAQSTADESLLSTQSTSLATATALPTLPTATGLTPAGAQPAVATGNADPTSQQHSLTSSSSVLANGIDAALAATAMPKVPTMTTTTSTCLTPEPESSGAAYTQEPSSLQPLYTSADEYGQAPSYYSPQTVTTATQYSPSPEIEASSIQSAPSYVTTVSYIAGSAIPQQTFTSDCDESAAAPPASSPPLYIPTSAAIYPTTTPSLAALPSQTPLTTVTLITGSFTTYSTIITDCDSSSMIDIPSPLSTSAVLFTPAVMPSLEAPPAPTEAPSAPPALPEPTPETSCSETTEELPSSAPPQTPQETHDTSLPPPESTVATSTNILIVSESSLTPFAPPASTPPPSSLGMTTSFTMSLSTTTGLNTTLSTIPRPTITSTTTKQVNVLPSTTTTQNGGFSQGSGTADPALFAGGASSLYPSSKTLVALGFMFAAGWIV